MDLSHILSAVLLWFKQGGLTPVNYSKLGFSLFQEACKEICKKVGFLEVCAVLLTFKLSGSKSNKICKFGHGKYLE